MNLQGRSPEDNQLFFTFHSPTHRLFMRLKPNPEGRISYSQVEKLAWSIRICPVRCKQDLVSGVELRTLCGKKSEKEVTLSYAQFEQVLWKVGRKVKGGNGLRQVLEMIRREGRKEDRNGHKLNSLSYTMDEGKGDDTKRLPTSRWSELSSLRMDSPIRHDSMPTTRISTNKSLFPPSFRQSLPVISSENDHFNKDFIGLISDLVEDFKQQTADLHVNTGKNVKTQLRRVTDFAFRTREEYFSPAFMKQVVFRAWKNAIASSLLATSAAAEH